MEHPCAKCGSPVEDGRPFCPQCRAPQVRVAIAAEIPESAADATVGRSYPEVSPSFPRHRSGELDRRIAGRAAVQAGLLGLLISMLPFLGFVLTGALAVYLYRRAVQRSPQARRREWGQRRAR